MARTCTICNHKNKHEINQAVICGRTYRDISRQFEISRSAIWRHTEHHIPSDLVKAKKADDICKANSLLYNLITLKNDAERITKKAETDNDLKTALSGIREQVRIMEILAKMENLIQQPQIDLTVNNFTLLKIHDRLSRKLEGIVEVK